MALTLAESNKLTTDQVKRGIVEALTSSSPIVDRLRFEEVVGKAYVFNRDAGGSGAAFRAINAGFTESTGAFTQVTVPLKRLGGDAAVDTFIEQTQSNLNEQMATQVVLKSRSVGRAFQDAFINGDVSVDAESFDGLRKTLTGGSQDVAAGTNGLAAVGADVAAHHAFLDKLENAISLVPGANMLVMNSQILWKLQSSARRLGLIETDRDGFGQVIAYYRGIPMIDAGNNASGTPVIPQTEVQGSSGSVCSSIYVINTDDESGVIGLTNGGIRVRDLGEIDAKPQHITRIEFFCAIAPLASNSAARLKGILNS